MRKQVDPEYIKAQRAAGWPDIHPEDYCHICGIEFEPWYTDRETWLAGTKVWAAETGREGICCQDCFILLYEEHNGPQQWLLTPEKV